MSLKFTLACSLIGGGLGYAAVLGVMRHTEGYRLRDLENRTDEARKVRYILGGTSIYDPVRPTTEAEDAYRGLTAEWARLKGEDFGETLRCRSKLAVALSINKKYPEAAEQYQRALNGIDRTLGWKNALALEWREEYATMLETMGKWDEAEVLWRKLAEAWTEMKGSPREPIWESLVSNLDHQEKYREEVIELRAEGEMFRPFVEASQRKYGNRRAGGKTMDDYRREEKWIQAEINLAERRTAAKQALEDAKRKWGEDHEETRACRAALEALKNEKVKPGA